MQTTDLWFLEVGLGVREMGIFLNLNKLEKKEKLLSYLTICQCLFCFS